MERIAAEIDLRALRHNYRKLCQRVPGAACLAVVKADAYGHGLDHVARALFEEGCRQFAVGDAHEGARLRLLLDMRDVEILLLGGVVNLAEAVLCRRQSLTPVLSARWQVPLLWQAGYDRNVWLKIDTGMARTGAEDPPGLRHACLQSGMRVVGILSHLACADTPEHPMNQRQIERVRQWSARMPGLRVSLLNTAGLAYFSGHAWDMVRPGIGLYGAEAFSRAMGLRPVMRLSAPVMQIRSLRMGEAVGYGASFVAPRAMRIAVVRAGYADGVPRALSHGGRVWFAKRRLPIVGRVCMDYCMVDLENAPARVGDRVVFWGAEHDVAEVAEQAGSIAYELLTRVGPRVPRISV